MKQLNILDLHRSINEKKMRTNECYDKILELCHKKIQIGANNQKLNCFIEVPSYVFGYPIFNFNSCIEYVYNSLKKNGFLVKYYFPKYLYISWDFDEINEHKREEQVISAHGNPKQLKYSGAGVGVSAGLPPGMPSGIPPGMPSGMPLGMPLGMPSGHPSGMPSGMPLGHPSGLPSGLPSGTGVTGAPNARRSAMKGALSYKPSGKLSLDLS
jgi:hypothetical protein